MEMESNWVPATQLLGQPGGDYGREERAQRPWEEGPTEGPGDGGSLGAGVPREHPGTAEELGLPDRAGLAQRPLHSDGRIGPHCAEPVKWTHPLGGLRPRPPVPTTFPRPHRTAKGEASSRV